jgi:hypothetical protein
MSSGFSRADTGKNGLFPKKKLDAIALYHRSVTCARPDDITITCHLSYDCHTISKIG